MKHGKIIVPIIIGILAAIAYYYIFNEFSILILISISIACMIQNAMIDAFKKIK